jgi:hypothetical protein
MSGPITLMSSDKDKFEVSQEVALCVSLAPRHAATAADAPCRALISQSATVKNMLEGARAPGRGASRESLP